MYVTVKLYTELYTGLEKDTHNVIVSVCDCRVVSVLINHCRDVIKYHDSNGDMALHLACRRGHLDVVKEILEWEPTTVGNKYT